MACRVTLRKISSFSLIIFPVVKATKSDAGQRNASVVGFSKVDQNLFY